MAYYIQLARRELERLEALPHLSPGKLVDVLDQVLLYLSDAMDEFREERRLRPGSPFFLFDYLFQDQGHGHQLLFYVNDAHAAAGILVIAFVDHRVDKAPPE